MTIKKPMKTVAQPAAAVAPAAGGATIADRFKLDMPDPAKVKKPAGKGALIAAIAGFVALAVTGVLTFVLYQHWEFLKGA